MPPTKATKAPMKAAMKAPRPPTKAAMKAARPPTKATKALKAMKGMPAAKEMQATKKAMKASATAAMTAMQTSEGDASGSGGGPDLVDWAKHGWNYNEAQGWCGRKSWKMSHRGAQLQRLTLDFRTMWVHEEWAVPARGGR